MEKTQSPLLVAPLLALLSVPILGSASAATLQLNIDSIFSGPGVPEGPTPWVAVTVDDSYGVAITVRRSIEAVGLVGIEYISEIYLNFDSTLDSTNLSFTEITNPTSMNPATDISTGNNLYKANGDGFFDIHFDFPPPPGNFASKFTSGETVVIDLTYTSAISADSFAYQSVNSQGGYDPFAAVHIKSIGPNEESVWSGAPVAAFEIPEPTVGGLLVMSTLCLLNIRRRQGGRA